MNPTAIAILENQTQLAEAIVDLHYNLQPERWKPYGNPGRAKSVRDAGYHLQYLMEALNAEDPVLFTEYLAWVKVLFAGLNFSEDVLPLTLNCTKKVFQTHLPQEVIQPAVELIDIGLASLAKVLETIPSFISGNEPIDLLAHQYLEALLRSDRNEASKMILDAAKNGIPVRDLYSKVFQRTQREIGRLWQTNQISVAQEHYCTAATQMIMSQLYPYIFTGERKDLRVVVACVGGELHEMGARMVADFFEMEGWDSYFLGANTPPESVISMVEETNADVLALSSTMTFHVDAVRNIITMQREKRGHKPPVLVGGFPFNLSPDLWRNVGADGYALDAEDAVREALRILA